MFGPARRGGAAARAAPYRGYTPGELGGEEEVPLGQDEEPSGGAAIVDKEDGAWTCKGCGNLNYRHREVCNTRKCALPRYLGDSALEGHPEGAWLCVGCGNVNYKHRSACHTRKCGLPFPGLMQQWAVQQAPMQPKMLMGQMAIRPMVLRGPAAPARPLEPELAGSWRCQLCNNVNYASREVCNTRKCRAPRPSALGSPGVQMPAARRPSALGGPGVQMPAARGLTGVPMAQAFAANRLRPPMPEPGKEASWTCSQCGNVNYAFRTTCNTRKCQAPRPF